MGNEIFLGAMPGIDPGTTESSSNFSSLEHCIAVAAAPRFPPRLLKKSLGEVGHGVEDILFP